MVLRPFTYFTTDLLGAHLLTFLRNLPLEPQSMMEFTYLFTYYLICGYDLHSLSQENEYTLLETWPTILKLSRVFVYNHIFIAMVYVVFLAVFSLNHRHFFLMLVAFTMYHKTNQVKKLLLIWDQKNKAQIQKPTSLI